MRNYQIKKECRVNCNIYKKTKEQITIRLQILTTKIQMQKIENKLTLWVSSFL